MRFDALFYFVGAFNSGRDLIHGRRAERIDINVGSQSPKNRQIPSRGHRLVRSHDAGAPAGC
jgi:hypothetical protein